MALCIFILPSGLSAPKIWPPINSKGPECFTRTLRNEIVRVETCKCMNTPLRDVTPCSLGSSLPTFRGDVPSLSSLPFYPEDGGTRFLRNVANDLPEYKASCPLPFYPEDGGTRLLRNTGDDLPEHIISRTLVP